MESLIIAAVLSILMTVGLVKDRKFDRKVQAINHYLKNEIQIAKEMKENGQSKKAPRDSYVVHRNNRKWWR